MRTLIIHLLLWTVLCAVAGIGTYLDGTRHGDHRSFWLMTVGWWCGYLVMMLLGYAADLAYRRHPGWLATPARIAAGYLLFIAMSWPLAMLGLAYRRCFKVGLEPGLANAWHYWVAMDKFEWFVVFVLLTMAFGVVVAHRLWQQRRGQARELADMRLALEQQRLAALRGQLEPHFMFNTLSAIGALVRTDDKPLALDGLARLADLLHYALSNSTRDTVSLREEWQFVRGYLDLQQLRFGPRLQVRIDGAGLLDDDCDCPPMLLQPLVENALRHDLECHAGSSDIGVTFRRDGAFLLVQVDNGVHPQEAPAAGLGIGLRGMRARLDLAYGKLASLTTAQTDGRFVALLRLPWTAAH
ncbi:hypothetical protein ASF61_09695 [Duganella sp. Leaf126]|nr:hypothetical protein ASF61_09695 [Duganella sp. Leaf126]